MNREPVPPARSLTVHSTTLARGLVLGAVLVWAFWPTLCEVVSRWAHDPRYSHGFLVPAFALFLLWQRRADFDPESFAASGWGMAFIGLGAGFYLVGAYYASVWLGSVALLPTLAGACLLHGGWPALRWCGVSIAFLVFMLPLPFPVEVALASPLQRVATRVSTYALQTLGCSALAEGNVIRLEHVRLGVVEACSGLSMLFTFFAITTGLTLLIKRSLWEKVVLVVSAVPIALIANIVRITATGWLHETVGKNVADAVYHDLAGWLMMPLALALFWIVLRFLSHVLVDDRPAEPRQDHLEKQRLGGAGFRHAATTSRS